MSIQTWNTNLDELFALPHQREVLISVSGIYGPYVTAAELAHYASGSNLAHEAETFQRSEILAWQPFPEPYRPEENLMIEAREQFTTYEDAFYPLVTLARLVIVREDGNAFAAISTMPESAGMNEDKWAALCERNKVKLRGEINDDPERFLISPGVSPQWV